MYLRHIFGTQPTPTIVPPLAPAFIHLCGRLQHKFVKNFPDMGRLIRITSPIFREVVEMRTDGFGKFTFDARLCLNKLSLESKKNYEISIEILDKCLPNVVQNKRNAYYPYTLIEKMQTGIEIGYNAAKNSWEVPAIKDLHLDLFSTYAKIKRKQLLIPSKPLASQRVQTIPSYRPATLLEKTIHLLSRIPVIRLLITAQVVQFVFNLLLPKEWKIGKPEINDERLVHFLQDEVALQPFKETNDSIKWKIDFSPYERDAQKQAKGIEIPDVIIKAEKFIEEGVTKIVSPKIKYRFTPTEKWSKSEINAQNIHYATCAAFLMSELTNHLPIHLVVQNFANAFFLFIPDGHPLRSKLEPFLMGVMNVNFSEEGGGKITNNPVSLVSDTPLTQEGVEKALTEATNKLGNLLAFKPSDDISGNDFSSFQARFYHAFHRYFKSALTEVKTEIETYENWQHIYKWSEASRIALKDFPGITNATCFSKDGWNNLLHVCATLATFATFTHDAYHEGHKLALWSDLVKLHVKDRSLDSKKQFNPFLADPLATARQLRQVHGCVRQPDDYTFGNDPFKILPHELKEEIYKISKLGSHFITR